MTSFSDNFNQANSTDLGAGWVEVSGDWTIVSNQLTPGVTASTVVLRAATMLASSDHYAQVTIAATTSVSQGVWCRGNTDITNGYLWRNNGSNWSLFSVVADSYTSIGSYSAAAVAGDVAKIQAVGSTIKAFVNGVERVSVVNTAVTTGTSVGIRSEANTALRFDNFSAADVSTSTALATVSSAETARPVTGAKAGTLGAVMETSTAQPLAGVKTHALETAGSTDTVLPLTATKTAVLTPVIEQNTAQPLAGAKTSVLAATETLETALPLTATKTAAIGTATETCTVRPLTGPSTTVPSPERTYLIPSEVRRLDVAAEPRTLTVGS